MTSRSPWTSPATTPPPPHHRLEAFSTFWRDPRVLDKASKVSTCGVEWSHCLRDVSEIPMTPHRSCSGVH
jgi:hypothetical protein